MQRDKDYSCGHLLIFNNLFKITPPPLPSMYVYIAICSKI